MNHAATSASTAAATARLKESLQSATAAALGAQLRAGEPLALHRRGDLQAMVIHLGATYEWLVERAEHHGAPLAEGAANSADMAVELAAKALVHLANKAGTVVSGAVDPAFRRVAVVQQHGAVSLALRRFLKRWGSEVVNTSVESAQDGAALLKDRSEILVWVADAQDHVDEVAELPRQAGACTLVWCASEKEARRWRGVPGLHGVMCEADPADLTDMALQRGWEKYVLG